MVTCRLTILNLDDNKVNPIVIGRRNQEHYKPIWREKS
jgi:hypothetical protein